MYQNGSLTVDRGCELGDGEDFSARESARDAVPLGQLGGPQVLSHDAGAVHLRGVNGDGEAVSGAPDDEFVKDWDDWPFKDTQDSEDARSLFRLLPPPQRRFQSVSTAKAYSTWVRILRCIVCFVFKLYRGNSYDSNFVVPLPEQ